MTQYQNHLVDPTFFNDAIEEFAFDYDIYVVTNPGKIDEYGNRKVEYKKETIRGSLQSQGSSLNQSKSGNQISREYKFYCRSLYRIDIGDIIEYKNNYLRCNEINDYDEFGVRSATLKMIKVDNYRDFYDYIKYLKGEKLI